MSPNYRFVMASRMPSPVIPCVINKYDMDVSPVLNINKPIESAASDAQFDLDVKNSVMFWLKNGIFIIVLLVC